MITAATKHTTATAPNSRDSGIELKNPAVHPASLLPSELDKKNTPIMRLTMRFGASLVTADRPTGLRHSSPHSSMKYAATSHSGLTLIPAALCAMAPAGTSSRNAIPANSSASTNFDGTDGWRGPSFTQIHANTGDNRITNSACTDTYHEDG